MGINDILCKEYDAVRGEIMTSLSNRIRVLSLGIAAIGLMWAAATALYKRTEPDRPGSRENASHNRTELATRDVVSVAAGPDQRTEPDRARPGDMSSYDRDGSVIAGIIFVFGVPVLAFFIGWLWLGEYERVQTAGVWQYHLEERINKQARDESTATTATLGRESILKWEHASRAKRLAQQTSKERGDRVGSWVDPTVLLLCLIVFLSVLIGLAVLGYSQRALAKYLFVVGVFLFPVTAYVYYHAVGKIRRLRVDTKAPPGFLSPMGQQQPTARAAGQRPPVAPPSPAPPPQIPPSPTT